MTQPVLAPETLPEPSSTPLPPTPPQQTTDPAAVYRQRGAAFGAEHARLTQRSRANGNLNLVLFFGAVAALTVASVRGELLWYVPAAGLGIAFIVALANFQRLKQQVGRAAALVAINAEGVERIARNWPALPPPPNLEPPPEETDAAAGSGATLDAATAADLDLLGVASLQHLLNTPTTPVGQTALHTWILQPAAPAAVAARQNAARELGPQLILREEIGVAGRLLGPAQSHYERFVAWAESAPWLQKAPGWLWAARLLPLAALGLAIAAWYGQPVYWPLAGVLLANLAITLTIGRRAADTIAQVEAQQEVFTAYAGLFALLGEQSFSAPALRHVQERLWTGAGKEVGSSGAETSGRADKMMLRLARLMPLAAIRRWVLFFPVEVATLWNFHLLWLLERWQAEAGGSVRGWLAALGEMEALLALATLHHDHPTWNFPELDDSPQAERTPQIAGSNIAHPLLPPDRAVGNNIAIGPPGSFLLVTGSNMSGKSTLLRAIGVNCVLAQMGAPVCADRLRLPPLAVASSMRVQDSLARGESFFMAELRGLKAVVDLADAHQEGDRPLLYLLDEILQGTNTAERQIAARHIIRRLVDAGAIGAVSTHDLTLAAAPELAAAANAVHFTESFTRGPQGPAMRFDFKLRAGVATSTNALKLMELIGLA